MNTQFNNILVSFCTQKYIGTNKLIIGNIVLDHAKDYYMFNRTGINSIGMSNLGNEILWPTLSKDSGPGKTIYMRMLHSALYNMMIK